MVSFVYGFDPLRLEPNASLNRVRIVDLPNATLPDFVRGRTAHELLSSVSTAARVRQHALDLGLTHAVGTPDAPLLRRFNGCFDAKNPAVREAAVRLAEASGQALASLVATLHRGDAVNRTARPEWGDDVWAHWATVRRVKLGGGLVSGQFGDIMARTARAYLLELGVPGVQLERAAHPGLLPLLGAAHSVPEHARGAAVLDFGHSFVKRAGVAFHNEAPVELRLLSATPVTTDETPLDKAEGAQALADRMGVTIATTLQEVGRSGDRSSVAVASMAGYFADNHPLPDARGLYAVLRHLTPNAGEALSGLVSARLGRNVEVSLVHDGSCAARTFAGEPNTAVIMLGTSLGVGFAPSSPLRTATPTFSIPYANHNAVA